MSKTKIVCTIGPATAAPESLKQLAHAGMSIARLNFSHGTSETHLKHISLIRNISESLPQPIKILQDLEGFRIRVGLFKGPRKKIELKKGSPITLIPGQVSDRKNTIPFDYQGPLDDFKPGTDIFIDDGKVNLQVISNQADSLIAEVIVGGEVREHKGINIPDVNLKFEGLTDSDKNNLLFGIENKVDLIAQSFVRNKQDVLAVREFVNARGFECPIIAKIENRQGIENMDEILGVADGIMIARGDMGVSLPIYEVPVIQKIIIKKCNRREKMVITATQMLDSMTENLRPTRAEVSDVANAILDGSDYVMLSGETAVGRYPLETVRMMQSIIDFTEKSAGKTSI